MLSDIYSSNKQNDMNVPPYPLNPYKPSRRNPRINICVRDITAIDMKKNHMILYNYIGRCYLIPFTTTNKS